MNTSLRTKRENQIYGIAFAIIAIIVYVVAFVCPLKSLGFVLLGGIGSINVLCSVLFFNIKSSDEVETDSYRTINDPVNFTLGILIIIGCVVIYYWSTDWSWVDRSRTNIHIVHDFQWLKYVFYPVLIIAGLIGLRLIQNGFKGED